MYSCEIPVATLLTLKGVEDVLNRQFALELSFSNETIYFIFDSEKEKEDSSIQLGDLFV